MSRFTFSRNPNNQHDFRAIKNVLGNRPELNETWEIIKSHFPLYSQTNGIIDLFTKKEDGGTFLNNWVFNPIEAKVAVATIKEIGCDCFFIVPLPSPYGIVKGTKEQIEKFKETLSEQLEILQFLETNLITYKLDNHQESFFPEFFSVHSTSPFRPCIQQYQQLAMLKILDNEALAKEQISKEFKYAETNYAELMKRISDKKI